MGPNGVFILFFYFLYYYTCVTVNEYDKYHLYFLVNVLFLWVLKSCSPFPCLKNRSGQVLQDSGKKLLTSYNLLSYYFGFFFIHLNYAIVEFIFSNS